MRSHFLTRYNRKLQFYLTAFHFHIGKTLWSAKDPPKYLAYCARTLIKNEYLDIHILDMAGREVFAPMRADLFSESLFKIITCIDKDESVKHASQLGFFSTIKAFDFITTLDGRAQFKTARDHLLLHLLAIEKIALFVMEDHNDSPQEYARSNKRILLSLVDNFQAYVSSLKELCK